MSERTSYEPGTPSWIDIGVPDHERAAAFYGGLFGWTMEIDPSPDAGGYGMFLLRNKRVAGVGPQMDTGLPPFWAVYVTVDDVEGAMDTAASGGATVVMGAMDVLDAGCMGVLQDPLGAFVSVWAAKGSVGCELVDEPGTFVWNELATPDLPRARDFYRMLFGWRVDHQTENSDGDVFMAGGQQVCGAHTVASGETPGWLVWFAVDDCDESATLAEELGGRIVTPPSDMDFGRGAVIADTAGALLGIGGMGVAS